MNLDDSGISVGVFPSKTNLKRYSVSLTPKMIKQVIGNLDSSKASGPDRVIVVMLKYCEPELSHILAELFGICLKVSFFQIFVRSHRLNVSLFLRMFEKCPC